MNLIEIVNEEPKTQEDWATWHNNHGSVMASVADLYQLGKQKGQLRQNTETSTKIFYHGSPDIKIVHNCGSRFVNPVESRVVKIPSSNLELTTLKEKNMTPEIINFLQALFNTDDKPEQILKSIENLSGYNPRAIKVPKDPRTGYTKVSVLIDSDNNFFIECYFLIFGKGGSYKVVK